MIANAGNRFTKSGQQIYWFQQHVILNPRRYILNCIRGIIFPFPSLPSCNFAGQEWQWNAFSGSLVLSSDAHWNFLNSFWSRLQIMTVAGNNPNVEIMEGQFEIGHLTSTTECQGSNVKVSYIRVRYQVTCTCKIMLNKETTPSGQKGREIIDINSAQENTVVLWCKSSIAGLER